MMIKIKKNRYIKCLNYVCIPIYAQGGKKKGSDKTVIL